MCSQGLFSALVSLKPHPSISVCYRSTFPSLLILINIPFPCLQRSVVSLEINKTKVNNHPPWPTKSNTKQTTGQMTGENTYMIKGITLKSDHWKCKSPKRFCSNYRDFHVWPQQLPALATHLRIHNRRGTQSGQIRATFCDMSVCSILD